MNRPVKIFCDQCLTAADNSAYAVFAVAKSTAGISLPNQSAQALTRSAFFTPKIQFLAGCMEALRSAASLSGKTNSVQPATLLLSLNGGSSLSQSEESIMNNQSLSRHPARTQQPTRLAQIQSNLEVIQAALCSQASLCRFDSESSARLFDIAGEIESVSDQIEGGCHE